jgi:hypothetical protein
MKKILFLLLLGVALPIFVTAQITTTWTGNISSDWDVAGNWTNGVPSVLDSVVIINSNNAAFIYPILNNNVTIKSLTFHSNAPAVVGAKIDFNGDTLTLNNGTLTISNTNANVVREMGHSTTGGRLIINNGRLMSRITNNNAKAHFYVDCDFTLSVANNRLQGNIFHNPLKITKNIDDGNNNTYFGGNLFEKDVELIWNAAGNWSFGRGGVDIFEKKITGVAYLGRIILGYSNLGCIYHELDLTVSNQGMIEIKSGTVQGEAYFKSTNLTGQYGIMISVNNNYTVTFQQKVYVQNLNSNNNLLFRCARIGNTIFQEDVIIQSSGGTFGDRGIYIGNTEVAATDIGNVTFVAGKSIITNGFSTGNLQIQKVTQGLGVNTHTHYIHLSGNANAYIFNSTLRGNLDVYGENILQVYNNTLGTDATTEVKVASNSTNPDLVVKCGKNTFKGVANITNQGRMNWQWGHNTYGADTFESDSYFNSTDNISPDEPSARKLNYKINYATTYPTNYATNLPLSVDYIAQPYYVAGSGSWIGTKVGFASYPRLDNLPTNTSDPDLDASNALANETAYLANLADETQSQLNITNATNNAASVQNSITSAITNLQDAVTEANNIMNVANVDNAYINAEGSVVSLYNTLLSLKNSGNSYIPTAQAASTNLTVAVTDLTNPPQNDHQLANTAALSANQSNAWANDIYHAINNLHIELNTINATYNTTLNALIADAQKTGSLSLAYNTTGNTFEGNTYINMSNKGRVSFALQDNGHAVFEKEVSIVNTSVGSNKGALKMAYTTANSSIIFQDNVTIQQNGIGRIEIGREGDATFEKNVHFIQNQQGNTLIGYAPSTTGTMILHGDATFDLTNGTLEWNHFTKTNTNPLSITTTQDATFRVNGQSIFNGAVSFIKNGSKSIYISNLQNSQVVFNGNVNLTNQTDGRIYVATEGDVAFNGNVHCENTFVFSNSSTLAIQFGGETIGVGKTTLADGYHLTIGTFTRGALSMIDFVYKGVANLQMTTALGATVNTSLYLKNVSFEKEATIEAVGLSLINNTFEDEAHIICRNTGITSGGNLFKNLAHFENYATNVWNFGDSNPDTFEDDLTIDNRASGTIRLGSNSANNIFQNTVTLNNLSTGTLMTAYETGSSVIFQGSVLVRNHSTGTINFTRKGNTTFEGTVNVKQFTNNTANPAYILFGGLQTADYTGKVTVTNAGAITFDLSASWGRTELHLKNLDYQSNVALNCQISNTLPTKLYLGSGSELDANIVGSATNFFLNGTKFNGTATFTKTGTGNDASLGGNVFNGVTRIINNSGNNAELYLATQTGDDFNADVSFELPTTLSGFIIPAYKGINTFAGNINITGIETFAPSFGGTSTTFTPTLGQGSGSIVFDGAVSQTISNQLTTTAKLFFREINIKQSNVTNTVVFDKDFTITHVAKFTKGKINLGNINMTILNASGANSVIVYYPNDSHVIAEGMGSVIRQVVNNNNNVLFPLGNTSTYTPLTMSLNAGSTSDTLRARLLNEVYTTYNNAVGNYAPTGVPLIGYFTRRSWIITETVAGGSNAQMTLQWNSLAPSDELPYFDGSKVSVVRYNNNTSKWRCTQPKGAAIGPPNTRKTTNNITEFGVFSIATIDAIAGPDQIICQPGEAYMSANPLNNAFEGEWMQIAGPSTIDIDDVNSPNTKISNLLPSSDYTLRWVNQGLEGACGTDLFDDIVVHIGNLGVPSTPITDVTWNGSEDTNWFNCRNWSDYTIPNQNVNVTIPDVSALPHQPIITLTGSQAKDLTLENGGVITIQNTGSLIVEQDLAIQTGGLIENHNILNVKGNTLLSGLLNNYKNVNLTGKLTNDGILQISDILSVIDLKGDFENNATFAPTLGLVKFTGANNITLSGTTSPILWDVDIDKAVGSHIILNQPLYISGTIAFLQGLIQTSSVNSLIINDDAESTEGNQNSYVNGPIRKIGDDEFVFPTGKNGHWARIAIKDLANTSVNDHFTAEYFPQKFGNDDVIAPINNVSVLEYWLLDRGNLGGGAGTTQAYISLYWEDATFSQINLLPQLAVAHFNGTAWENAGGTPAGNVSAGNVTTLTSQSSFSPWTFASLSDLGNPLPILMTDLKAVVTPQQKVQLSWKTLMEKNASHFEIERSRNAKDFQSIGQIQAKGNSTSTLFYQMVDEMPYQTNYYRIKMVDTDGKSQYSNIVNAKLEGENSLGIDKIYPNPFVEKINVMVNLPSEEDYQMYIRDAFGRIVFTQIGKTNKEGFDEQIIDLKSLPNASYILELRTSGYKIITKKIVKF